MHVVDIGKYFDQYWLSMNTSVSDARSLEKAALVDGLLGAMRGRILDVGCGRGVVAADLMKRGREVVGIDASQVAVDKARESGVEANVLDLESEDLEGRYEAVLCLDVLQHSPYPLHLLKKILQVVRDEGVVLISLPNEFHLLRRIGILFGKNKFARYDGPHPRLFWKREISRLILDAGLEIETIASVPLTAPRHRIVAPAGRLLALVVPSLMAIGYVVKARKRSGDHV